MDFSDMGKFQRKITRFIPTWEKENRELMVESAVLMHVTVRKFASGYAGGPNVRSGAYLSSIQMQVDQSGWKVYTNAPQGHRLEYGFVGMDSLGRNYDQKPRPHFRPAKIIVVNATIAKIRSLPAMVWRKLS